MPAAARDQAPINKHERAYRLIRERIESGLYQPGQRVIIDALARDFSMSQVPIREAIRRLQAEGWLTYRHNSGPEIANIGMEQWQATMELLAILEGYATALAAPHIRKQDLKLLRQHISAMQRAIERFDVLTFSESNHQFHGVIYDRCPNRVLVERISETQAQLDSMRGALFPSMPQRGADSITEHCHLVELFENGASFDAVESSARAHKLNYLDWAMRQCEHWARARRQRSTAAGAA